MAIFNSYVKLPEGKLEHQKEQSPTLWLGVSLWKAGFGSLWNEANNVIFIDVKQISRYTKHKF
jgi:hypothetical protein